MYMSDNNRVKLPFNSSLFFFIEVLKVHLFICFMMSKVTKSCDYGLWTKERIP